MSAEDSVPPHDPAPEHRAAAALGFVVLVVSDTRTRQTDTAGAWIAECLTGAGHTLIARDIVPDERDRIASAVRDAIDDARVRVVLVTGGTGIAPRDVTPEAVAPLFERELPAFATLFAQRSFAEIGPAAMLSRACAGIAHGTAIFVLPGSGGAVRTAVQELILPELDHIHGLLD